MSNVINFIRCPAEQEEHGKRPDMQDVWIHSMLSYVLDNPPSGIWHKEGLRMVLKRDVTNDTFFWSHC